MLKHCRTCRGIPAELVKLRALPSSPAAWPFAEIAVVLGRRKIELLDVPWSAGILPATWEWGATPRRAGCPRSMERASRNQK